MKAMARGMACIGIAASALLSGSAEQGPQPLPDFTGTSAAVFVNPQPANAAVAGVGTDSFAWGQGGGASTLTFIGTGFSRAFGEIFSLGTLIYSNGASTSGVATSVDFRVTITLTVPGAVSQPFTQSFALINTPNIDNQPGPSADIVFVPSDFPDAVFELEGVSYTLNILGFGVVTGQGHVQALRKFHVREGETATAQLLGLISQTCVLENVDPVRERINEYPNCNTGNIGLLAPNWGRFGSSEVLEADSGDRLHLRCENAGEVPAYKLYYTRPGGAPLRVGMCPFEAGCNEVEFFHSGDKNKNGKPDCFVKTVWRSADYNLDDAPNPWTGEKDADNLLDHAVSIFTVSSNFLDKKTYKWKYAVGPPVPFHATCKNAGAPIPIGALVNSFSIDPPLGPETEAFFDEVMQRMALLPASQVPMGGSIAKACDLDGDGDCDAFDALLFDDTVGTCDGHRAYDPRADVDQSGCTDARDRRYLFENDEDGDGVPDGADNCPATANPGQADWNANGLGDACEVNVMVGDLDNDRDVDRDDLAILLAARNTMSLGPADRRDLDGDSKITALDGRKLTLLCTRPACATK